MNTTKTNNTALLVGAARDAAVALKAEPQLSAASRRAGVVKINDRRFQVVVTLRELK